MSGAAPVAVPAPPAGGATGRAEHALAAIAARDPAINAFTAVFAGRARAEAAAVDARRAAGVAPRALDGVPYAVKNLFDVAGVTTIAGSMVRRDAPHAEADAVLVARLRDAGAVLTGALNMDEFAYGFTTENSHVGPCRNPHDPARSAGGSSGGSGAAVAAGLVPLALGSDTNGSIRVPASLCGVWGLKPTYGRLSRRGTFPFVASLDHVGPLAASVGLLAAAYDAMQGPDALDPACAPRPADPAVPTLERGMGGLRVGVLGGWFEDWAGDDAREALARVADALGASGRADFALAGAARAAAFAITATEGGALHREALRKRYDDYEPLSRDRFVAGTLAPAEWAVTAQRVRARAAAEAARLFGRFDLLLAPATPTTAPPIGTEWLEINGRTVPARPGVGLLTQPISCIGLPVVVAPVVRPGRLPIGVQLVVAPWREADALRAARALEAAGVCGPADPASLPVRSTLCATAPDPDPDSNSCARSRGFR